ncbi:carboxypeptidase regulatory-like domain-containing protein [Hyalangium versicolor]|uniref:carboxypeptidase regulatory-like domain-containing protein n=1 Tax=Hyalangium versicolor TaxID=2861190 RepID=UPI001CC982D9|nr:carboxypeptidase regulatory-like domain-containing protein [Hyalangium versicolor]
MRRWVLGIAAVVAGVAITVAGLSLQGEAHRKASGVAPRSTHISGMKAQRVRAEPTPPPGGSLRIRGIARDEHGPVAGVRVSATWPVPGETLSELPCSLDSQGSADGQEEKLPDCLEESSARVLELVLAREGEAPVYAETVTAADGGFVLEGLPEGDFTLWALGEQSAGLRSGVKAGAQDVELVLDAGLMVGGTVMDSDGQPLAGVALTILHERHTRFFDTLSGTDGRFSVGPLPKGDYGLTAELEGWLPEFRTHADLEGEHEVFLYRPSRLAGRVLREGAPVPGVEVVVTAEGCRSLTERKVSADGEGRFALEGVGPCVYDFVAEQKGLYAVGHVELEPQMAPPEVVLNLGQALLVEGTVRDEAGQPVEGASVAVNLWGRSSQAWQAVTTQDGHYRLGPMEPGTYALDIERSGYVDVRDEEYVLELGMEPVEWVLQRAATVSGMVVDEEGKPVGDLSLQLSGSGSGADFEYGDHTETGADGRFSMDVSRVGTWSLVIDDERFAPQRLSIQAPSQELRVVVRRGATVVGTVTDEQGVPQPRVFVTLWNAATKSEEEDSIRSSSTDSRGRFILKGLPEGRFVVEAKRDIDGTERSVGKPVELHGSGQLEVALRFDEGHTLSGIVVDGQGAPVEGAAVRVMQSHKSFPSWRRHILSCQTGRDSGPRTGPDGRFTLRHLVADTYELTVEKTGYFYPPAQARKDELLLGGILFVEKGTTDVRVVLERKGRIRGRVIGPDGAPLRYFTVDRLPVGGPDGTFERPFMSSGVEHLEFDAPDLSPILRSVEVHEGVDVELGDVRMGPGRQVKGRVLDAETGVPIAGAQVHVVDMGAYNSVQTRADGSFELSRVDERALMLEAIHDDYRSGRVPLGSGDEPVTLRLDPGARIETTIRDREGKPVSAVVELEQEDGPGRQSIEVKQAVQLRTGVEPGLYLAYVIPPKPRSSDAFLAQRVQIPASGRVGLSFVARQQGATLVLHAEGASRAMLFAGVEPPSASERTWRRWEMRGVVAKVENGVVRFQSLPPGRAAVLLLSSAASSRYHREDLELPEQGVVERVVQPRWQPVPEE